MTEEERAVALVRASDAIRAFYGNENLSVAGEERDAYEAAVRAFVALNPSRKQWLVAMSGMILTAGIFYDLTLGLSSVQWG